MKTIFVSANDTGAGKTYVTASLALHLVRQGAHVQVVKAVETGVTGKTPHGQTDAGFVAEFVAKHVAGDAAGGRFVAAAEDGWRQAAGDTVSNAAGDTTALRRHCGEQVKAAVFRIAGDTATAATPYGDPGITPGAALAQAGAATTGSVGGRLSVHTLQTFSQPLAPVDAARVDGKKFDFDSLLAALRDLPTDGVQWRLVEGAGGLAVPLESGCAPRDWADFALAIAADAVVLVVSDRLGAINQARLLGAYARARGLPQAGLWLNEAMAGVPAAVRASHFSALSAGVAGLPLLAAQRHGAQWPKEVAAPWLL